MLETTVDKTLSELSTAELLRMEEQPLLLHEVLFSSYFGNWRWYLRYIGDRFSAVVSFLMLYADVRILTCT